jgi:O-antigen/teichoic acid export membrane protein
VVDTAQATSYQSERSGLIKRLGLGVGSSALSQAINALQTILLLPLFLRAWGSNVYGQWLALTSFTSYLALLDFGGQTYIGNLLAIAAAKQDWNEFRRILSQGLSLFLFLSTTVLGLLIGCVAIATYFLIPGFSRSLSAWEAWVIALQSVALVFLAIPGGVYVTIYRAVGLFTRGAMVGNVFRACGLGLSALLLFFRTSPVTFAASSIFIGLSLTTFIVWDTRRVLPQCRGIKISPRGARAGLSQLGRGASHYWLISLAQMLNQQGVILVIVRVLGSASLPLYVTHKILSNIPGYIVALVQGPAAPELSRLWATGQMERLSSLALRLIRALIVLTGIGAVVIWFCAPSLYPLWTGKVLAVDSNLLAILLVQALIAAGWSSASWCLLAANRPQQVATWSVSNGLLTLLLVAWLAAKHGLAGAALGSLIGDFCCGLIAFPLLLAKLLSIRVRSVFRVMLFATAPILLLFGAFELLRDSLSDFSVPIAVCLVGVLSYPAFCLAVGCSSAREALQLLTFRWLGNPGHK